MNDSDDENGRDGGRGKLFGWREVRAAGGTVVAPDERTQRTLLRDPSRAEGSPVVVVADSQQLDQHLDGGNEERVVVIGPSVPLEEAASLAAAQRVLRPALGVVLVRDVLDAALLTSALEAGVRAVVQQGDDVALLVLKAH